MLLMFVATAMLRPLSWTHPPGRCLLQCWCCLVCSCCCFPAGVVIAVFSICCCCWLHLPVATVAICCCCWLHLPVVAVAICRCCWLHQPVAAVADVSCCCTYGRYADTTHCGLPLLDFAAHLCSRCSAVAAFVLLCSPAAVVCNYLKVRPLTTRL